MSSSISSPTSTTASHLDSKDNPTQNNQSFQIAVSCANVAENYIEGSRTRSKPKAKLKEAGKASQ